MAKKTFKKDVSDETESDIEAGSSPVATSASDTTMVLGNVIQLLDPLDNPNRTRILRSVSSYFDIELPRPASATKPALRAGNTTDHGSFRWQMSTHASERNDRCTSSRRSYRVRSRRN